MFETFNKNYTVVDISEDNCGSRLKYEKEK